MRGFTKVDYPGLQVPVGSKIKFENEKQCYNVMASNACFLICTKPLNLIVRKGGGKYEHELTVMYCIVDRKEGVRGTENLIFGMGAETKKDCEEMLHRVTTGDTEVSYRNRRDLDIEHYYIPKSYFAKNKKHAKKR